MYLLPPPMTMENQSAQLVRTQQATYFLHVEQLLASRLSRQWDPGGSKYACWVLNCKYFDGNTKVSFRNMRVDLNVWEKDKFRVISIELYVQWDPGIMKVLLMLAMFWENLQSILGPDFCPRTSKDDHSLDGITLSQASGQRIVFCLPSMWDIIQAAGNQLKCRWRALYGLEIILVLIWRSMGLSVEQLPEATRSSDFSLNLASRREALNNHLKWHTRYELQEEPLEDGAKRHQLEGTLMSELKSWTIPQVLPVMGSFGWELGCLQNERLQLWRLPLRSNARNEVLQDEKKIELLVALAGLKPSLSWLCFSVEELSSLPHVAVTVKCITSPWDPGVAKNPKKKQISLLKLEGVTLIVFARGEVTRDNFRWVVRWIGHVKFKGNSLHCLGIPLVESNLTENKPQMFSTQPGRDLRLLQPNHPWPLFVLAIYTHQLPCNLKSAIDYVNISLKLIQAGVAPMLDSKSDYDIWFRREIGSRASQISRKEECHAYGCLPRSSLHRPQVLLRLGPSPCQQRLRPRRRQSLQP